MNTSSIRAAFVLSAGVLLALPASAAVDAFIWFDEPSLQGESMDVNHKGWHEVSSFQLEQVRRAATTIGSATGGAGAGKVSVHDISVTKRTDKSSPNLMLFCANGKHIPTATLTMRKAGGTQQEYLVIKLKDVLVSSYRKSGGGGAGATETFTLNAGDATVEHTLPPRAGGGIAPAAASSALVAHTPTPTPRPGQNPVGAVAMPKK